MTDEQKRIAIAEACGNLTREHDMQMWPNVEEPGIDIPSYLTDLNAMHEAEKILRTPQGDESDSTAEDRMFEYAVRLEYAIDATARQRADAFIATLNLTAD